MPDQTGRCSVDAITRRLTMPMPTNREGMTWIHRGRRSSPSVVLSPPQLTPRFRAGRVRGSYRQLVHVPSTMSIAASPHNLQYSTTPLPTFVFAMRDFWLRRRLCGWLSTAR